MQKESGKIQQLFRETLLNDEDLYWFGEPSYGKWRIRWADVAFWLSSLMIFLPAIMAAFVPIYVLWQLLTSRFVLQHILSLGFLILWFASGAMSLIGHIWRSQRNEYRTIEGYLKYQPYRWWQTTFYAVTSQRVLISDQGRIRGYWYHLLDTPILSKSKSGTADILLYSNSYEAKKKKPSTLDVLRDIPVDEAEEALNILKQAQEEALSKKNRLPVQSMQVKAKYS